jgi:hypothetical protein
MVPLATTRSGFEAKVLAARLGAEGIVWQLRGGPDGVYPVGDVDILVRADDLTRARELLLADEVEDALSGSSGDVDDTSLQWWLGAALVLVAGSVLLARVLTLL